MNCIRCGKKVFALYPGELCKSCHETRPAPPKVEKKTVYMKGTCRICGGGGTLRRGLCQVHYRKWRLGVQMFNNLKGGV